MGVFTSHRQSHFAPAFLFLPRARRTALKILYAVCRLLDDAADTGRPDAAAFLAAWKEVFSSRSPSAVEPFGCGELAREFLASADRYGIPLEAMRDLIDQGVSVDLQQNRFQTAMDLESYCYGVAGTVGLACLPIFGAPLDEGKQFAVRLGIAVQWVNVIRDVGVDADLGRIYLPLDHLEQFGYTEEALFARKYSDNFRALMEHEHRTAQGHFQRAWDLLPQAHRTTLLPARIMGRIYQKLLEKIKTQGFSVLNGKIRLNFWEKLTVVWTVLREK